MMKLCAGVGFVNFYEMIFLENILLPQHEFLQSQVRQTISQAFPPGYPVTRVFLVSRLKFAILSRTIEVPASLSSFFPIPAFSRY